MAEYTVEKREVWISFVTIEASTPKEAIEKVYSGEGDLTDSLEYSHDLERDTWAVDGIFYDDWRNT